MILGRSPNLILGTFTALFNVVILAHIGGFAPDGELVAAVNIAAGALIALIANTASIQIEAGKAAASRLP
jgi:hypothetical protein